MKSKRVPVFVKFNTNTLRTKKFMEKTVYNRNTVFIIVMEITIPKNNHLIKTRIHLE